MEYESTVDAGQEANVEPQTETIQPTDSAPTEVAPEAVEKPVQSPEENAKFKEVRTKAAQEAQDKLIAEMYGESHGIYTKADYDRAVREQKEQEMLQRVRNEEVDPQEFVRTLKENDPEYQELTKMKKEIYVNEQIKELNAELKDIGVDIQISSLDDLAKLENADMIIKKMDIGNNLTDAYFLANKKNLLLKETEKIRNETISKIKQNGDSTPGSLADTGQTNTVFTREQVEAMSMAEVNKNYDLIMKSMKSW